LPDELELQLEKILSENSVSAEIPIAEEIGRAYRVEDAPGRYIEYLKQSFPQHLSLEGIKIVIDCANGAAYKVGPIVFEELGAEVISLGVTPNGTNINDHCGALYPKNLCEKVREHQAHIGIALDGDADRVVLCDEKGQVLDGDAILAISAQSMLERGLLKKNTVVGTVMSNFGLERYLLENHLRLVRTQVGDRYIVETMRKEGYNLGGEPSGHLIYLDHATTGDGMLAALQVLALMLIQEKPLSEMKKMMRIVPQHLENVRVQKREELSTLTNLQKRIQECEKRLGTHGRLLLRYSGTEPLLRIMVECENESLMKQVVSDLKTEVIASLGEAS
ncbi:MAG: phosphoglucosamine mutase, partial [Deltaproteobacteria bacterium]|nr:phosphoglucosamine mutase [Deltaproteobacteria bacterium]